MSREPIQWANYPNDHRDAIGQVMGPNLFGEFLTVVTAEYDPVNNQTRLGFSYTRVEDIDARPKEASK